MNAPQPDPEPESTRPTSSQSTDLTNALAALRVHDASMPDYDYEAEWREIEQEERLVRGSLLKLFQVTLVSGLSNFKLCDAETQRRHYQNFHLR